MSLGSTLISLARALSYRARSLTVAENARAAYLSFKDGLIGSADALYKNQDPVFAVMDCEMLGPELGFDVRVPVTSFSRSTTPLEKLCLGLLLKLQNPATIFEFGTYRGATTLLLFKNSSTGARLFSFDIPSDIDRAHDVDRGKLINLSDGGLRDDFSREFFPKSRRVKQVYADLREVDWAYIRELARPDFIFIDADHSYEGCLRDSRHIIGWVGEEAMVVWHDASWKNFYHREANYGVHASIVDATSPDAVDYTFRIKDTSLIVRSKQHAALFKRHLYVGAQPRRPPKCVT